MMRSLLLVSVLLYLTPLSSQTAYKFRVQLKDKGGGSYSIEKPEEFLSKRAIERRKRQNIKIDTSDLPISGKYIETIESFGCLTVAKSKWMETVTIHCEDSSIIREIRELEFVDRADCVWIGFTIASISGQSFQNTSEIRSSTMPHTYYGYGFDQVKTVNGHILHHDGYYGEGMQIAVMDAGFAGIDDHPLSTTMNILGSKDFVFEPGGESEHGFEVLTLMASDSPGKYTGTAPKAGYWLFRTEDGRTESPVEEDYWIAAVEYADSAGVDLINSSIGYMKFDHPFKSYTWNDLDGKTAFITRAANIAASKGIFLVNSAGNERMTEWEKIVFPADAEHVLTVGAVNKDSIVSIFSSTGSTADGRVKPDIAALGNSITFLNNKGEIYRSYGTSYSSPVMCGLAACLWEAFPGLTNYELLDIIRKSSHRNSSPDEYSGYGIPNMERAFKLADNATSGIEHLVDDKQNFKVYSDNGYIKIENKAEIYPCHISIYSLDGKLILKGNLTQNQQNFYVPKTSKIVIVNLQAGKNNYSIKVNL
ncbi:MAG TPA: serine protease [Dysgonomonas sp.]|nr:serine protease [Dysgonomonas sp.]